MSNENTTETACQRRLREAREAAAALDQDVLPNDFTPSKLPTPGEPIYALVTGTVIPMGEGFMSTGAVLTRGQTLIVTANMLQACRDRHGRYTGVGLVHDEVAQFAKYGEILFRAGEAPADLEPWLPGDPAWSEARERTRREAHAQPTEEARAAALRAVHERFGPAASTTTTLNAAPNASIRQAEEQQERIRAKGVVSYQHVEAREYGNPKDRA